MKNFLIKFLKKTAYGALALLIGWQVFRFAALEYLKPCADTPTVMPTIQHYDSLSVLFGNNNDRFWEGSIKIVSPFERFGVSDQFFVLFLLDANPDGATFGYYEHWIAQEYEIVDVRNNYCQYYIESGDWRYQSREPSLLLNEKDFNNNWSIDHYFEFATHNLYRFRSEIDRYFAGTNTSYKPIKQSKSEKYEILMEVRKFNSPESAEIILAYFGNRYYPNTSTQIGVLNIPNTNFVEMCPPKTFKCEVYIQVDNYVIVVSMFGNKSKGVGVSMDAWIDLVNLAVDKIDRQMQGQSQ
ncbi:MAG: hypothetical protein OEZ02_14315 [Anaerolineae bacterium]|nr:hypothetical protein [Anaerolineae bacterium]